MIGRKYIWAVIFCFIGVGTGCDNTVEPIADRGEDRFAIYGFLDMRSTYQQVRVEILRETILSEAEDLSGISLFSVDQQTGQSQTWRDSTVVLTDGTEGSVFVSNFKPEIGHTYSLTIRGEGQILAEAIAKIPDAPSVVFGAPVGNAQDVYQQVTILNRFDEPLNIFVTYVVVPGDDSGERTIRVPYGQPGDKSELGWEFNVSLALDKFVLLNELNINTAAFDVGIRSATVEMSFLSPEWKDKTSGVNLSNAKGFFGSIGLMQQTWVVDANTLSLLGFSDQQIKN